MKKLLYLFAIVGITTLTACEGDAGPQGPAGENGQEAYVYETPFVSFTAAGNYGIFYEFPITFLNSDHVLVYRLAGVESGEDVWRPLPETHYFNDGTRDFSYDFDHTRYDVNITMNGNDLATVSAEYRIDQIFRIVVVPGQPVSGKNVSAVDFNDYKAVIAAYGIDESKIVKLK